jgi:hypothetical protein
MRRLFAAVAAGAGLALVLAASADAAGRGGPGPSAFTPPGFGHVQGTPAISHWTNGQPPGWNNNPGWGSRGLSTPVPTENQIRTY